MTLQDTNSRLTKELSILNSKRQRAEAQKVDQLSLVERKESEIKVIKKQTKSIDVENNNKETAAKQIEKDLIILTKTREELLESIGGLEANDKQRKSVMSELNETIEALDAQSKCLEAQLTQIVPNVLETDKFDSWFAKSCNSSEQVATKELSKEKASLKLSGTIHTIVIISRANFK